MYIVGIDPGQKGALVFINVERECELESSMHVYDMPILTLIRNKKKKNEVSPHLLADILKTHNVKEAWVEKVGAMPGQGVSSMFQFGRSVGMIEGVLATLDIPVNYVTPQVWRKSLGLGKGKDASRLKAMQLYPVFSDHFNKVKHDGRADALCIALHGSKS